MERSKTSKLSTTVDSAEALQVLYSTADPNQNLKLSADGKTVLIPQPSDDPNDPLNWSTTKKNLTLLPLILASILTDLGVTWGNVLFEAQAQTFDMSVPAVANSISGCLFLQGPAGVLAVPLVQRFGRLPVLFWSQLLSALMVMAAALSPNYACFTAFRTLQGFVNTAPQVVGLSIIHDLFFFHERTRKINLWVCCLFCGPFLGPFIAAWLILAVSWRADFGVLAGLHGFAAVMVVMLGQETLYDEASAEESPRSGLLERLKLLTGIRGYTMKGRPGMWTVFKQILDIQVRPQILLVTVIFIMVMVAWVIGLNVAFTQIVIPPPYSFSRTGVALGYLAPIVGSVLGGIWGHWFNDWLCNRYIRMHQGRYVLENRLWAVWFPTIVNIAGLVLYGQTLQHSLHWMVLMVAWACVTFSLIAGSTPVSAYCLDAFPRHAALVASIINMWRTTGGFCVIYFQLAWINSSGPGIAFGSQAIILGAAFVVGVVLTQMFGGRWRRRYPPPAREYGGRQSAQSADSK